ISSYAFSGCRNLQSLTLGENVTNIGDYAFYNCDKISSSLELPNSVTTIGNSAFENCGLLTETLTIGSDVSSIGNKAFSNCNFSDVVVNLENTHFQLANNVGSAKILIPKDNPHSDFKFKYESDKPIGGIAYGHLQIKGGPQIIGDEAFKDCNKLTGGIEIPSSVTTIGESAFEGCKGFDEDLYFEPRSNILTIGEKAFKDCSGLIDRLQLDCDKFIINSSAFANCNKITYLLLINFPEAKQKADTNWADDIFSGWDPLYDSSVEIFTGDELEPNWEARDFAVSKGLKRNWVGGEFKQWDGSDWNGHTGSEKLICDIIDENSNHPYAKITSVDENYTAEDLIIPDYVKMPNGDVVPLEEIGERSFENNCGLTGDLTIGGQIKIIGESAFQDLMNLNGTLIIKDNVKTIKPYAFSGCGCITNSLTIPNSVTSIGVCAFYECVNLQSLKLSDNLTNIGIASFYDCLSLTGELIIPGNVKTMGSHAFAYCKGLDSLIIQNKAFSSQHAIPPSAFEYCISLASIQIPSDITEIGDNAFTKCSNLEKLEFNNNNIDNIGENAFCDCISLKSISLNSLKKVSKKAFQNCRNLEGFSITFPFGAESIGDYAFAECEKITNIPFITPSSTKLKNIGEAAFINCCNLEFELQLPYSLENIGSKAFENCCKLTGLSFNNIFNSLLKNIGDSAFENCNSMVRGLSLPGSLEYIGECAFKDCSSFNQGLGFNNSPYLNPSNLTIGKQAFFNCSSFTGSLNIQPAVIEVGDSAFEGCSSFTLIEFNAFTNEPTWTGENIFSGWKESGTGSKKVYAQNGTWTSSQAFQFAKKKGLNNSWIPG
ncbi:MAG: leucine-rich repeat protein, partial [Mycoplasmataceae bacterium]|nr:leucine-rich repeat protein [Mycoplasmataceae bacterium]